MTTRYKTRAFVFKKSDRNEADRVYSVFTDDFGRLDIFAKAIRKNASKLRSGIDTFYISDIEFVQGKNRKTLIDAAAIEKFSGIFQDLEKFGIANRIGDVLDSFVIGQEKDEDFFNLLNEVFHKLNDEKLKNDKYTMVYYYFLWNALSLFGYKPESQKCNICRDKLNFSEIYFSAKTGGTICKKCLSHDAPAERINADIVKVLRLILNKEWQIISKLKVGPESQKLFKEISNNYYSYTLSREVV
ncbi:MAG: DNA repair protein RecO [Candidatus Staskawiczbacteria bacterium]|nr:DNA repair protein RecO [Candidatus Staskawiczbacteria bacterium]